MRKHGTRIAAIVGAVVMTMGMGMNAWASGGAGGSDSTGIITTDDGFNVPKKLTSSAGESLYEQIFSLTTEPYHA